MLGSLWLSSLPNMASRHSKSKKQSDGSRRQPPSLPEGFVPYLDENPHNCTPILDALGEHGVNHERHGSHFPPGTEDTVWLPFVGKQGRVVLTKDNKIRFNELEKLAIQRTGSENYFASGNYSRIEMAEMLVTACGTSPDSADVTILLSLQASASRKTSA